MRTPIRVLVAVDAAPDELRTMLTDGLGLRAEGSDRIERRVLDSFDWRIWSAGAVLEHEACTDGGSLVWRRRPTRDEAPARIIARQSSPAMPSRVGDLGSGPVRRLVEPVLGVRALLPQASTAVDRQRFALLDGRQKTVVRAAVESVDVDGADSSAPTLGCQLVVTGVRGYDTDLDTFVARLRRASDLVEIEADPSRRVLDAVGALPRGVAGSHDVVTAGDASTLDALTTVCTALLDSIEANETGVRDDIDTEFLRDVRRSAMRMTVVLRHADDVVPVGPRTRYRTSFERVLSMTSDLRRLDEHLLDLDGRNASPAARHRSDLSALRGLLVELRTDEQRRVAAMIESDRHRDLLDGWREFLAAPVPGPRATKPVGRTAARTVRRLHRDVVGQCREIGSALTPALAGSLFERTYELQYLLEVYRPLYADHHGSGLASELALLVDALRTYRSCDGRIDDLRRFADVLDARHGSAVRAWLAMGQLASELAQDRSRARDRAIESMVRFDRRKNRKRLGNIAATIKGSAS